MRLKTRYDVGNLPHAEHPNPQAERESWLCLNGKWDFYKLKTDGKKGYEGTITVPFSPEPEHSGIDEGFVLECGETLVYSRKIVLEQALLQGHTVLHFGAVDSACEVFWNSVRVGGHEGGFTAFSIDVTQFARLGENEIRVECTDEATRNGFTRGKQSDQSRRFAVGGVSLLSVELECNAAAKKRCVRPVCELRVIRVLCVSAVNAEHKARCENCIQALSQNSFQRIGKEGGRRALLG